MLPPETGAASDWLALGVGLGEAASCPPQPAKMSRQPSDTQISL